VAIFIRFLLAALRGHPGKTLVILGCLLVDMGFNAGISLSFKFLIDHAVLPRDMHMLVLILGVLFGGVVVVFVVGVARDYIYSQLTVSVLNDLRERLFSHIQRLSLDFHARTSVGDITARFATDLAAVEAALAYAASGVILPLLNIVGCVVLLFVLEWRLALVALLVFPSAFLGPRLLDRRAAAASYERKRHEAQVVTTVQQSFSAPAVVKAFGLERYTLLGFKDELRGLAAASVRLGFLSALAERSAFIGFILTSVLVTAGGAHMAITGHLTVGSFMSYQALFLTLGWTLAFGMQYIPRLVQATGGLQRIVEVFDEVPRVADLPGATARPSLARSIAFEDVTFGYRPDQTALDRVVFIIHAGESVAIVGPSGAGKSTVLTLLARFYDPIGGRITVDGWDLRSVPQDAWRARIGLVPQESVLFDTTIRENIRLGQLEASAEAVEAAADLAGLRPLLATLPEGYDTRVGEGGGQLSGGQRQRVALARALLRDPSLLLLDEVTSALDAATEAAINATLAEVANGRMVVTVTHRLASVTHADRIVVLDGGRLVEQGTHAELLGRDGVYAHLWHKQSGFVVSEEGASATVDPTRLRAVPIFASLMDGMLQELAGRFAPERVPAGQTVVEQGDPADKFYLIVRGSLRVTTHDAAGAVREVAILEDGDHFGEIALLWNVARTATVRTRTPCLLLSLDRAQFQHLAGTSPELLRGLRAQAEARLGQLQTLEWTSSLSPGR
jgi:ATP-binding cassette subfamily B protein